MHRDGFTCEFSVPLRAIPWKAATVTRRGGAFKAPSLVAWQDAVALHARLAMAGRSPYDGPVRLEMEFFLTRPRRGGVVPDWTNLSKSTEDAIQGIVIENDRQVVGAEVRRVVGSDDYTYVKVIAI